jgi:hypothetical protein
MSRAGERAIAGLLWWILAVLCVIADLPDPFAWATAAGGASSWWQAIRIEQRERDRSE